MPSTPASATTIRQQRHDAIRRLVAARPIRSQAELAELLAADGLGANQATLSRDLRELGVAKTPDGYALPGPAAVDDLTRTCREWLAGAEAVAHQLVLRTPPGGAQPLAIGLDVAGLPGVAGTIAGDDTVLVICRTPRAAARLARDLLARIPR
jgi:transcriptional regulator of arginine metabolism